MLIVVKNIYNDIEGFVNIINSLPYENTTYGEELVNLDYKPDGIIDMFSVILHADNITIDENSGKFLKPTTGIKCIPFWTDAACNAIIALCDTTVTFWRHIETGIVYTNQISSSELDSFVINECLDITKWEPDNIIKLSRNDCLIYKPNLWISFSENSLIQTFQLRYVSNTSENLNDVE